MFELSICIREREITEKKSMSNGSISIILYAEEDAANDFRPSTYHNYTFLSKGEYTVHYYAK